MISLLVDEQQKVCHARQNITREKKQPKGFYLTLAANRKPHSYY
jgi:hypothetical protein